jgi:hypothetical protein
VALPFTIVLYEVLVLSSSGERFTIERAAPLADGGIFEQDSESYRVLAMLPGYGPFDDVIEVERLTDSETGPFDAESDERGEARG